MAKKPSKKTTLDPKVIVQLEQLLKSALRLHQAGNFVQAKQLYQQIIRTNPNHAAATHFLGAIEHQQNNNSHAEQLIRKALKLDPNMPQAYNNLGIVLRALGKHEQAKVNYLKLIKLKPNYAEAYCNLGAVYKSLDDTDNAINSLNKAIKLDPNNVNAYNILGIIHRRIKNLELSSSCLKKVIKLEPSFAEAHNNLGNVYFEQENYKSATLCYESALKYKPDYAEALNNLGRSLKKIGQFEAAIVPFRKALALQPENASFLFNCAFLFHETGQSQLAIDFYQKIIALNSTQNDHLLSINCFSIFPQSLLYKLHCNWGRETIKKLPTNRPKPRKLKLKDRQPIRIGYVSPDFRKHSVSYFFEPLIAHHDKNKVEVFCYYNNTEEDQVTRAIKSYADHWRPISMMNDMEVVNLIHKDKIDILIDLAGHTEGHRLEVFAYKPAPLQLTWLGYPNTTGLSTIDYRLTDEQADPELESEQCYSEKLVHLPHGFLCFQGDTSLTYEKQAPIEKQKHITFGSFNNFTKVTHDVLKVWSEILIEVPDSKLILKSEQLVNRSTQKNILAIFIQHGVATERITLLGKVASYNDHLAMYSKIDIALDPFPYNGTTTTFEALWMGVPTLTLKGIDHIGRVGSSILHRVGLNEFIAQDRKDYILKAKALSENPKYLSQLRNDLREKTLDSDLCNAKQFAEDFERCLLQLAMKHTV